MNILDVICIGVLLIAAIRCFFRGFIDEIMAAISIFLPLLVAIAMYKPVTAWFKLQTIFSPVIAYGLAFVGVFIIIFIVVKFLHSSIESIVDNLELNTADRILGFIVGLAEGIIIIAILLIVIKFQPLFNVDSLLQGSFFARILVPIIAQHIPGQA